MRIEIRKKFSYVSPFFTESGEGNSRGQSAGYGTATTQVKNSYEDFYQNPHFAKYTMTGKQGTWGLRVGFIGASIAGLVPQKSGIMAMGSRQKLITRR
jgi:hypothetical protein